MPETEKKSQREADSALIRRFIEGTYGRSRSQADEAMRALRRLFASPAPETEKLAERILAEIKAWPDTESDEDFAARLAALSASSAPAPEKLAEAARALVGESGEPPVCLALGIKDRWRALQRVLQALSASPAPDEREVYAVEWGNEFPAEIDSLWSTKAAAQERADEKNAEPGPSGSDHWSVTEWTLRGEPAPPPAVSEDDLVERVKKLHTNERNGYGPGMCHCDECCETMIALRDREAERDRLREAILACIGDAEGQEAVRKRKMLELTKGQVQLLARALGGGSE